MSRDTNGIWTVGELRAAIADVEDDVSVSLVYDGGCAECGLTDVESDEDGLRLIGY